MAVQATTSIGMASEPAHPKLRHAEEEALDLWKKGVGFVGPIALYVLPIPILFAARPELFGVTMAFYSVVFFGVDVASITAVTTATALGQPLHWWYIFLWIMWGQVLVTAFLLWNLRFLRKWGRADRFIAKQEKKAEEAYAKRAWLRKFHFWGLTIFTLMPVGSGVYVGILLGKATGMRDGHTFSAIILGTTLWTAILAYGLTHATGWILRIVN